MAFFVLYFLINKGERNGQMLSLLFATITTSAVDSLNPVAITQQFVLQGLVKKRYHIWYFIIATAIVNFTGGILVYHGLAALLKNYMDMFLNKYSLLIFTAELILGIIMLIFVSYQLVNRKIKTLEHKISAMKGEVSDDSNETATFFKASSLNPFSLFFIGSIATICELPTALPYFAFLAIILNYELPVITSTLILLLYNLIYASPLMLLYFLYVKCQDKFDKIYSLIKEKISKYSNILTPIMIGSIGILLIYHAFINMMK